MSKAEIKQSLQTMKNNNALPTKNKNKNYRTNNNTKAINGKNFCFIYEPKVDYQTVLFKEDILATYPLYNIRHNV
jgi:hypothetical protein